MTRSRIELFWTAKNIILQLERFQEKASCIDCAGKQIVLIPYLLSQSPLQLEIMNFILTSNNLLRGCPLSNTSENILGKLPQIWTPPPFLPSLRQFTLCPISREGKILKVSAPQEILANIGLAAKYDNNVRLKH